MALITITGNDVRDSTGRPDNRPWTITASTYQDGEGGVITDKTSTPLYPIAGVLTFQVEAGITAWIRTPDETRYLVRIPDEDADLWGVIEAGVAYPPTTSQDLLAAAVGQYVVTHSSIFRSYAEPVDAEDPETLYQWKDGADGDIGDPVSITNIITEPVAAAAATAAAPDAVDAELASRAFGLADDGEGGVVFASDGVPTGGPSFEISAGWSGITGKPSVMGVGDTKPEARGAIGVVANSNLHTTFVDKADGAPPSVGDEGVAVTLRGGSLNNIRLTVLDGLLQAPTSSGVAGDRGHYWNQPLVGAKRIGCTFKIAEGVDPFGAVTLVFWEDEIPTPYLVPNSPMHLSVTVDGWELGVFTGGNYTDTTATIDVIGSGTFDTELADDWDPEVAGSGTLHRMEVVVVGDTATIALPDGSVATVTDSRIASIDANVACHEIYHHTADAAFTAFETIWASADEGPVGAASMGEVARVVSRRASDAAAARPVMARYAPSPAANITVPNDAYTDIAGLPSITFTLPPDCTACEVEATLYYEITAAAKVLIGFASGATLFDPQVIADMSAFKGALTYRGFRTGMTAGTGGVYTLRHRVVSGTGAVLKLDSANGYVASWKITPITAAS